MTSVILFISGAEIFVIVLVIVLLFGAKKIPDLARGLGKGMNEFKKATNEIKKEINQGDGGVLKDIKDVSNTIKESTENVKSTITDSEIGKEIRSAKSNFDKFRR